MISLFPRRNRYKKNHLKFQVDMVIDDDDNVVVYLSRDDVDIVGIKEKIKAGDDKSIGEIVNAYILNYVKNRRKYKKHE